MKEIICKAIFKGKDGSMGFRSGQEYWLNVKQHIIGRGINVVAYQLTPEVWVPYSNMKTFLQNWEVVSI